MERFAAIVLVTENAYLRELLKFQVVGYMVGAIMQYIANDNHSGWIILLKLDDRTSSASEVFPFREVGTKKNCQNRGCETQNLR